MSSRSILIFFCLLMIGISAEAKISGDEKKDQNKYVNSTGDGENGWEAGISRRVLSPTTDVWLAGYGTRRTIEEKVHDIWAKVLALKDPRGKQVVMVTTDHQGMSRLIYEDLFQKLNERFHLDRSEFMLTFSHNHSGPRLRGDLVDYYPSDDEEDKRVDEYSDWMEGQIIEAVAEALNNLQPVDMFKGEGECDFAVNRRDNKESEVPELLAAGKSLKGVTDHYVPVLSLKNKDGKLIALLFGYACHPTTLSGNQLLGDYPGFAQINLENRYPGVTAMFFNACGADMNPLPRRTIELCEKYGKMLSDAVEEVIDKPMLPVSPGLRSAFRFVKLNYEEVVTVEKLKPLTTGGSDIQSRWARRMLNVLDKGLVLPSAYHYYPVMAWQLGKELLFIGTGGETVVDYSLRFKREYGVGNTWVFGYTNTMVAYIPSRRVWEEGGYEGGPHLDEYGHPAWRWAGDVEDQIAKGVHEVVRKARKKK